MLIDVVILVEEKTKNERQSHLDLIEECIERGGNSTNHKGVLAQYLNTTIPHGMRDKIYLCHACNNDRCSNPKHLYWGTPKENIEDSILIGTHLSQNKNIIRNYVMSDETKEKISNRLKGRPSNNQKGINGTNSGNYAKGFRYKRKYKQIWINNGINQTRIKEDSDIPNGYIKGKIR